MAPINIYIFHERGTQEHYRALTDREKTNGDIMIRFREFSIVRFTAKSIIKLDANLFFKQLVNICFIAKLAFKKNLIIIVGIAPYDYRLVIYYHLLKRHNYFYHTSKTTWGYRNYSKRFLANTSISKNTWAKFINNATGVFCTSGTVKNELYKYYHPKTAIVISHAIKNEYTRKINITTSGRFTCLYVGRMEESKGIRFIIEIAKNLPVTKFVFKFVGRGSLEEEVKHFCAVQANCEYLGYKEDPALRSIYESADVLLLPSVKTGPWEELFGMVIIEAMARGCVPVTTDHTGPKEIITNNLNGFFFSEEKYVNEAKHLLLNLENNRVYLKEIQKRAFAEGQSYSPHAIYKKWNTLLKASNG